MKYTERDVCTKRFGIRRRTWIYAGTIATSQEEWENVGKEGSSDASCDVEKDVEKDVDKDVDKEDSSDASCDVEKDVEKDDEKDVDKEGSSDASCDVEKDVDKEGSSDASCETTSLQSPETSHNRMQEIDRPAENTFPKRPVLPTCAIHQQCLEKNVL